MTAFITPTDVEEQFGISRAHLAALRFEGKGPRYYRPTPKKIFYTASEVSAWIEASARYGTSEAAASA